MMTPEIEKLHIILNAQNLSQRAKAAALSEISGFGFERCRNVIRKLPKKAAWLSKLLGEAPEPIARPVRVPTPPLFDTVAKARPRKESRPCRVCKKILFRRGGAALRMYCDKACARVAQKLQTYGISPEQYYLILRQQQGRCAICRRKPTDIRLGVDHTHDDAQRVRALLCHQCNVGIGLFKESQTLLAAAIIYLEQHKHVASGAIPTPSSPFPFQK